MLRVPILMYHHVHPLEDQSGALHPDSYLTPEELDRHLDHLCERGFETLTLGQALARERLPRRTVVLTFDDGCRCFSERVVPLLRARGLRATLFAVAGELGGSNSWDLEAGERQERLLPADELGELSRQGVEIGCHSYTHPDLTGCRNLYREVIQARQVLEQASGEPVTTFCYPYGSADERVRQAVFTAGYRGAVSILGHPGARPADRFALPRLIVRPGESLFELDLKLRGLYPLWSRLPRLGILQTLRRRPGAR